MPTINELLPDTPDAPDTGQQLPGGNLGTVFSPDYVLSYLSPNVMLGGEVRPLKWQISRADGVQCDIPTGCSITVYDALGNSVAGVSAAALDPAPPALTQIVAASWTITDTPTLQTYLARLIVTEMVGGETRIDEQIVVVRP